MDQAAPMLQLRCVLMALTLTVPVAADTADAARTLERETGEHYPARADIVLPDLAPDTFKAITSGADVPQATDSWCCWP